MDFSYKRRIFVFMSFYYDIILENISSIADLFASGIISAHPKSCDARVKSFCIKIEVDKRKRDGIAKRQSFIDLSVELNVPIDTIKDHYYNKSIITNI